MSVYFTSDLHFGHRLAARLRGFSDVDDHDRYLVERINMRVKKRDKLFILGDVAFSQHALFKFASRVNVQVIEFLFGNHDLLTLDSYRSVFLKIHGVKKYRNFWLSHIPVHENELLRCTANIHGHVHVGGLTKNPEGRYFNVNCEFNGYYPVSFDYIEKHFKGGDDSDTKG